MTEVTAVGHVSDEIATLGTPHGQTDPTQRGIARRGRLTDEQIDAAITLSNGDYAEAVDALEDPASTIVMPMTVAARGTRP